MTLRFRENSIVGKLITALNGFVGNLTGNVTGNLTGNVTGNVTGDVTGNVTGNVVGGVKPPLVAVTADGAITIPSVSTTYFLNKAGVAALTLANPTAGTHDNVTLTFISTTAQAHTVSNAAGSGFFSTGGSGKDVATFGGAIGDGFACVAYNGKWYIDPRGVTNVTLG